MSRYRSSFSAWTRHLLATPCGGRRSPVPANARCLLTIRSAWPHRNRTRGVLSPEFLESLTTREAILKEINDRTLLARCMVGLLYPLILSNEVAQLRNRLHMIDGVISKLEGGR